MIRMGGGEPKLWSAWALCLGSIVFVAGWMLWLNHDPEGPDRQAAADDIVSMAWGGLFPLEQDNWCYWWNHDRGYLQTVFADQPYKWNSWQDILEEECPLPLN